MQASRDKCRWVPHDSMIADALTKRHGNSVTMLKFVKTGQLSIVDEDKELAERHQFREVRGGNLRPHDSTGVKAADLWTGNNDTLLCKDNTACLRTRSQHVDVAFPEPVSRT